MQTMRFAEGYHAPARLRPSTLGLTLLTTGFFVSGLFFLNPRIVRQATTILEGVNIPLEQPKPKPEPTPEPAKHQTARPQPKLYVPPVDNMVKPIDQQPFEFTDTPPVTLTPPTALEEHVTALAKPPVMIGPSVDPRYASNFQPAYPTDEIRAGNAGRVTVKVLIGTDGRVKDIERVSAASDSFWEATRRQALAKWRFKPATRDGVAYESWKTMNVSFVLNQDQ